MENNTLTKIPPKEDLKVFANDLQKAAETYGKSERTIRRWLEKYNLYKPKKNFGARKLNIKKARKIRALYDTDQYTQKALGKMFGVTQSMIGRIVNNLAYKINFRFGGEAEVYVKT